MGTEIDVLVVGDCLLQKKEQDQSLKISYEGKFEDD
jgi:hypothetical protein